MRQCLRFATIVLSASFIGLASMPNAGAETGLLPLPSPKSSSPAHTVEGFHADSHLRAVHFDFDRATIRPQDAEALDMNAAWINGLPEPVTVAVEGGADQRGSSAYNRGLSERRARVVKDYLVARGVPADRIVMVGRSKDLPACHASTEVCWQRNRRVDLLIKGPERQAP